MRLKWPLFINRFRTTPVSLSSIILLVWGVAVLFCSNGMPTLFFVQFICNGLLNIKRALIVLPAGEIPEIVWACSIA